MNSETTEGQAPREYRLFRKTEDYLGVIFFVVAYLLMYCLIFAESLNVADPSTFGLSKAFAYSLFVWVLIMLSIIYAAARIWR